MRSPSKKIVSMTTFPVNTLAGIIWDSKLIINGQKFCFYVPATLGRPRSNSAKCWLSLGWQIQNQSSTPPNTDPWIEPSALSWIFPLALSTRSWSPWTMGLRHLTWILASDWLTWTRLCTWESSWAPWPRVPRQECWGLHYPATSPGLGPVFLFPAHLPQYLPRVCVTEVHPIHSESRQDVFCFGWHFVNLLSCDDEDPFFSILGGRRPM